MKLNSEGVVENWEEKFEGLWEVSSDLNRKNNIKYFIYTALNQQRRDIVGEIKKEI